MGGTTTMFKITHRTLRNPHFMAGLNKLTNHDGYKDFKTTYNITRIGATVRDVAKDAEDVFLKMVKAHGTITDNNFEIPDENKEKWLDEVEKFYDHEISIERHPLKVSDVESVKLTPVELDAMAFMIEDLDSF